MLHANVIVWTLQVISHLSDCVSLMRHMNEYTKAHDVACMKGIFSFIEENTICKHK